MTSIDPVMIERACGGWLARTPDDHPLQFAVTGPDEQATRAAFAAAAKRWLDAAARAIADAR